MQKAISDFDAAVRVGPNSFEPYMYRGFVEVTLGNATVAAKDFAKAISINPKAEGIIKRKGFLTDGKKSQ